MGKKVSALFILDKMATMENEVYAFPLSDNFKYARTGKGGWGELHIAVPNHIITNLDKYVGSLYLANRDQYLMCENELQNSDDEICPECNGTGEVSGDYFSEDGMTVCLRCNGKGVL